MSKHDVETANVVASVAHDLRSPLNAVIGFSRLLLKGIDGALSELQAADVQAIHANGQAMLRMVDCLIALAKAQAGWITPAKERVYLHPILDKVALLSVPIARELGINVRYEIDHVPAVCGDPLLLQQGIERLFDALLRMIDGGQVEVGAEAEGEEITVRVVGVNPAGLSPIVPHILEAFRTAGVSEQARVDATALYLITSRQLLALNGSTFQIETPSENELRLTLRLTPFGL
jgi:K+-sensing histidine kinase KdpD